MIISPQTSFAKKYSRRRILKKERKNGDLLAIGAYNIYTMGNTGGVCTGQNNEVEPELEGQSNRQQDQPQRITNTQTIPTIDQNTDPHPQTSNRQSKEEITMNDIKAQVRQSVQEPFVVPQIWKLSTVLESGVDMKKVTFVDKNNIKRQPLNSQDMINTPFEVIILTISKELDQSIKTLGEETFFKYKNKEGYKNSWKLHGNGYYINYLAKDLVSILTYTTYFEGQLEQIDGKILPVKDGILITEKGMYTGSFREGKAHGKGTYKDRFAKTIFKGEWRKGKMISGMIDNDNFRFLGRFVNNKAEGDGQIKFKQTETIYKGGFHHGLYHTKQPTEEQIERRADLVNGLYESKDYIYEGQFRKGRKDGVGTLVENERNYRDKKVKYRPPEQFYGKWQEDHFVEKLVKEIGSKSLEKKKKSKQKDQQNDNSGLKDSANLKDSATLKDSYNLKDSFNPMDSGYLNESAINRFIPARMQQIQGMQGNEEPNKAILPESPPPIKENAQHQQEGED